MPLGRLPTMVQVCFCCLVVCAFFFQGTPVLCLRRRRWVLGRLGLVGGAPCLPMTAQVGAGWARAGDGGGARQCTAARLHALGWARQR